MAECPLLAQSGHRLVHRTCPLLGVKRTCFGRHEMPAYDPVRTLRSWALLAMSARSKKWSFLIRQSPIKGTDCATFEAASGLGD